MSGATVNKTSASLRGLIAILPAAWAAMAMPVAAQAPAASVEPTATGRTITGLSAMDMFALARRAEERGEPAQAKAIYTALAQDPDQNLREEARFRHAQLLEGEKRYTDAALLLRAILDDQPQTQRVRLELARVQAMMGDQSGAYRSLRQAQAGGLPPEISALVKQYTLALRAYKPLGGSFELALAPDSNINRSTSAPVLDTVIAPLQLSQDAQQQSGIGVKPSGQIYARLPVAKDLALVPRLSGQGSLYGKSAFNDVLGTASLGVEYSKGRSFYSLSPALSPRWYGGRPYSLTQSASLGWRRLLGKTSQIQLHSGVGWTRNHFNDLQSGLTMDASAAYEHALSAKSGGSLTFSFQRQDAHDPGYATTSGGARLLYYREIGKVTLYGSADFQHLGADARLLLFPQKRKDDYVRIGAGVLFRTIEVAGFSPVVRLSREINTSTIGLYRYRRTVFEIGIDRSF